MERHSIPGFVIGGNLARLLEKPDVKTEIPYAQPTARLVSIGCDACVCYGKSAVFTRHRETNLECSAAIRAPTYATDVDVVYDVGKRAATNYRVRSYCRSSDARRGSVVLEYIRPHLAEEV